MLFSGTTVFQVRSTQRIALRAAIAQPGHCGERSTYAPTVPSATLPIWLIRQSAQRVRQVTLTTLSLLV